MAKSNDYENKEKENKEMNTGTFTQYHLHASTKNHVHINLYVISTKNYFT